MVKDLFPGFQSRVIDTPDGGIFARVGGQGPPLLLLHGYPETHAMWHRVASTLAQRFTVVATDLRGYGRSFVTAPVPGHQSYSKRAMACDMKAVMAALGFSRFAVMAHDRGARVAYRMMLDEPSLVSRGVLLDIITTADLWSSLTRARIMRMYHWPFLAQPAPLPERMIGADPRSYLEGRFKRGGLTLPAWLDPAVLEDFSAFCEPARIQASCEDYRAGATCDVDHDEADQRAGRQIERPLLLLWGDRGNLADMPDPLALWRRWSPTISGHAVNSGHFIAEENPTALLAAALPFLEARC